MSMISKDCMKKSLYRSVLVNDIINILCEIIYDSNLVVDFENKWVEEKLLDYYRLKEQ